MEEIELEEGEAFSYQDDDASIDPNVAFSYIDEKIHNVLGHFQKDFEGGVSAENLGAKFGGYGSFLPTHPWSPVWSHPRTPPKVQKRLSLKKALGFGVEREMVETELEEGEACSYQDDDASIDPDVALSYIIRDEKIRNVLGHFQKDFEGGVPAENLGAKFGGYGSFLPIHPQSPVWSHPRTPPKVQNNNTPSSPNNLQLEGGHHNSMVPSTAPQPVRHGLASTGIAAPSASKVSSVHDSVKRDLCRPSIHGEELTPTFEVTNKSAIPTDQMTLKVQWGEPATILRWDRVSPWELELPAAATPSNSQPAQQIKRGRLLVLPSPSLDLSVIGMAALPTPSPKESLSSMTPTPDLSVLGMAALSTPSPAESACSESICSN